MFEIVFPLIYKVTHFKTFAGIICDSGAASMRDCHVFVDEGMTNPKSKHHSVNTRKIKNDQSSTEYFLDLQHISMLSLQLKP